MKLQRAVRALAFGLLLLVIPAAFSSPAAAQFGIGISVRIGPPALPVYEQPYCPGEGYLWTPGYWAWDDADGYYWVPGTWVEAPEAGYLWTPGYWGFNEGAYLWNAGYWGPHVGFYGGINYGFGYGGDGFYGGEWRGGNYYYNTAVVRVNTTVIRNVYVNNTVIVNNNVHVSYNGGQGGINARPTAQQENFSRERHVQPVAAQQQQIQAARQNRSLFARVNQGRPAIAATPRPGQFSGNGVVAARAAGAAYHAPTISPREARVNAPANRGAENRPAENRPSAGRPVENRPPANRPAENRATPPADRPFVPPNRNNTANRPDNNSRPNASQPNNSRPNNDRPNNARPSNDRPSNARPNNAQPNNAPPNESRPNSARENAPRPAPQQREATPQSAPRPAPQPHEAAPRQQAPQQAPQREAPPREAAPRQERQAPPPHEAAPKPEHQRR